MTSPQDLLFPYDEKIDLSKSNIKPLHTIKPRTSLKLGELVDLSKLKDHYENQKPSSSNWTTTSLSAIILQTRYWTQYWF